MDEQVREARVTPNDVIPLHDPGAAFSNSNVRVVFLRLTKKTFDILSFPVYFFILVGSQLGKITHPARYGDTL